MKLKKISLILFSLAIFSLPNIASASNGGGNVIGSVVQCTLPDGTQTVTYQLYCKLDDGQARY
ncbi:hypothetical protein BCU70_14320 [Vibrio sp. 10N.286.49.C2]|nr:hypothetical protein BCU70_14320 [Vibrio sp. 10N.286.49.C2]PMH55435.1 hypothetical protein BCU66_10085 [Vibrio sp. 10N.286.49.B1]PMH80931.1 hypothetical protein BCU58_22555 [Vibrio sp. 10N.286.48.B7]